MFAGLAVIVYLSVCLFICLSVCLSVYLYFVFLFTDTVGSSMFAGLAVMILLMPINALLAMKQRSLQVKQMKLKDSRIKLMSEVLNGMKVCLIIYFLDYLKLPKKCLF